MGRDLSIKLVAIMILLLAVGIPAIGPISAQRSNMTASEIVDLVRNSTNVSNSTGLGNVTDSADDLPFVNDTETSELGITDIVINEVELNPRGSDTSHEWIELYNPADIEANVSDFEIRTSFKSATIKLPFDAVIERNGTYVVEIDDQTLSNTAESLTLANASGDIVDKTPSLVDKSNDGRTWQRIPDGNNEWKFAAGTQDELNDPDGQISATYTARAGSTGECHGTAGCAEGMATRIVDGDTLYVRVNGTEYKVDLALASAPSRTEEGFIQSRSFTQSLCLGSSVLVDQDDKLLASDTSVIAVVYCASTNLNSELLDNGHATLNLDQCATSEFAGQRWARDHGC